jgi:cellulose synthase/poly-beta-1,6-N-acetylglucosamine synthase-like glycosyltransferase
VPRLSRDATYQCYYYNYRTIKEHDEVLTRHMTRWIRFLFSARLRAFCIYQSVLGKASCCFVSFNSTWLFDDALRFVWP